MQEKEDQNQAMYDKIKRVKEKSYKNKKQAQAALDKCETPDPSLPPFPEVESEPFGDSSSFKFNDDAVFEKLNEFANSTYQMGESLLRKITLPDFFSRSSSSDSDTQNTQQSKRDDKDQDSDEASSEEENGSPRQKDPKAAAEAKQDEDDDETVIGMSVLASRKRGREKPQKPAAAPESAAEAANQSVAQDRINNLKERAADKLREAGKSIWGYFSSAA